MSAQTILMYSKCWHIKPFIIRALQGSLFCFHWLRIRLSASLRTSVFHVIFFVYWSFKKCVDGVKENRACTPKRLMRFSVTWKTSDNFQRCTSEDTYTQTFRLNTPTSANQIQMAPKNVPRYRKFRKKLPTAEFKRINNIWKLNWISTLFLPAIMI